MQNHQYRPNRLDQHLRDGYARKSKIGSDRRRPSRVRLLPAHEARRRLRKVRYVCNQRHAHLHPVEMVPLTETRSHHGTPMLVLACPHPGCNSRAGYVIDCHSGKPRKLFRSIDDGC